MNNPNTMEQNERFDALWANLKEQVRQAREKRTDHDTAPVNDGWPTRFVSVRKGDIDGSSISIDSERTVATVEVSREELLGIAAHCICAAEEIDADMLPHEILDREAKQAVKDLVRQPFPADDEQRDAA